MAATAPKAEGHALPRKRLAEAVKLKADIAGRSEDQVRRAVREARIEEYREAIGSWNAWTEKNGLPLERCGAF